MSTVTTTAISKLTDEEWKALEALIKDEVAAEVERQTVAPPWLDLLVKALGWQGGTIHQAIRRVRELVEENEELKAKTQQLQATIDSGVGPYGKFPAVSQVLHDLNPYPMDAKLELPADLSPENLSIPRNDVG